MFWLFVNNQWVQAQKSTTKNDATHPIWNENFYFRIDTTTNNALYIQVWDRDAPPPSQQFVSYEFYVFKPI
jgi:Ca2+-dependent lipid-binding protein